MLQRLLVAVVSARTMGLYKEEFVQKQRRNERSRQWSSLWLWRNTANVEYHNFYCSRAGTMDIIIVANRESKDTSGNG